MNGKNVREQAWKEFQRVANAETANGCETLALFKLVPQFSSAPQEKTKRVTLLMQYWSSHGRRQALVEAGAELYNWNRQNGYHHR